MFRYQYDTDVGLWSPQGRLFQVEYAMEAVNLGTATVGLKSEELVVLVALSKPTEILSISLPKIFKVDQFMGMAISGITSDARNIGHFLQTECISYRHTFDESYPVGRLASTLGNKLHVFTQGHTFRPVGVGMLLAGYDETGAQIYQIMPSANVMKCKAMALGARSQGSRTYLGRNKEQFPTCSKEELICHGINAINAAHPLGDGLNISLAIVGKDQPFKIFTPEECASYQQMCKVETVSEEPVANESQLDLQSNAPTLTD